MTSSLCAAFLDSMAVWERVAEDSRGCRLECDGGVGEGARAMHAAGVILQHVWGVCAFSGIYQTTLRGQSKFSCNPER